MPTRRLLAIIPLASAILLAIGCGEASLPRSVVLVTLDTTRVDHLSCYGYELSTSPALDAFAERSVRFRRAWSTSSWTLPAHASLFTGLFPSRHGARYQQGGEARLGDVLAMPIARYVRAGKLSDELTTLAELLSAHGYQTGAFVAGPWLHRSFGLLQGFGTQDDKIEGYGGRPADEISDRAIAWLDELPAAEPYMLFANYFDPHAPYSPRAAYSDLPLAAERLDLDYEALMSGGRSLDDRERAILNARYDAEIRWMDEHLGRLLEAVLERPGGDQTLIVITADHGEALGDDGRFGHGFWLSEELVRIPLLVRFPEDRDAGKWSDATIQLVDVLPLVAEELGLDVPDGVEGVGVGERKVAFAELHREPTAVVRFGRRFDRSLDVAIAWPHKLERSDEGGEVLYRLSPEGLREVPAADEELQMQLEGRLAEHLEAGRRTPAVAPEVDQELVEALRRLGYVE